MIRIGISGRRAVGLIAVVLVLAACGNRDEASAKPFAEPSAGSSQRASSLASAPLDAAGMCPEIGATSLPADLRPADRAIFASGPDPAGVRVLYLGAGGRELTLLSGIAGEIPRGSTVEQLTIRNRPASLSSPSADVLVALWLEAAEGAPCSQYAVVASKLSRSEMEAVLAGIR